jgi:adenylate/nucleoside-diphosphate kinase
LYDEWRNLQKNAQKVGESYRFKENDLEKKLDLLFDIAHSDALKLIKIEDDKKFLLNQRLRGRPGYLGGIDIKGTIKENICIQRKLNESKRKEMYTTNCAPTSILLNNSFEQTLETDRLEQWFSIFFV